MIFFWAVNVGKHYELYGGNWYFELKLKYSQEILVFSKWQEALGGNLKVIVSGGAASL